MKHTPSRIVWATLGTLLTVAFVGWGAFNVTVLLAHGQHTEVHRFEASAVQRLVVSSDAGRITVRAARGRNRHGHRPGEHFDRTHRPPRDAP